MIEDAIETMKAEPKLTQNQLMDKCRRKFEEERQKGLNDPVRREAMKKNEVMVLQAMNGGAQARLKLSDQAFSRLLDLQAEQVLIDSEAPVGNDTMPGSVSVNPQIAAEFGDDIAAKWASYQREFRARDEIHGVANLLADANMSLSDEQRRKLTHLYADQYDMESNQIRSGRPPDPDSDGENPNVGKLFEKELSRKQALVQRIQAEAASFLTPAQLELLRRKYDRDSEQLRSVMDSIPKDRPAPEPIQVALADC
jgi:hypothetical protein